MPTLTAEDASSSVVQVTVAQVVFTEEVVMDVMVGATMSVPPWPSVASVASAEKADTSPSVSRNFTL